MGGHEGERGREDGSVTHSPFSTHSHTSVDNVLAQALAVNDVHAKTTSPRRVSATPVSSSHTTPAHTTIGSTSGITPASTTPEQQTNLDVTVREPSRAAALCFACANCNLCTAAPALALKQIGGGGMHEISPTADEINRARQNLTYNNIDPRTVPSLHHLQTGSGRVQKKSKLSTPRRKRPVSKSKNNKGAKKPAKKSKKQSARKKPASHKRRK